MPSRKLNIPRIKRAVMFMSGIILGGWGALTGLSAQAAASPYISFMLGYSPPTANARAFMFAMWSAVTAAATWVLVSGRSPDFAACALIAVGAVVGAVMGAKTALAPRSLPVRLGRTLVTIALMYVVIEGIRARFGGPSVIEQAWLRGPVGWLVSGAICGILARVLALPIGVFLVPSILYAGGFAPDEAVVLSLSVSVLAGLLPAVGYMMRTERDEVMGPSMSAGGVVGGAIGGYALAHLSSPATTWPLTVFGITAMLLSSWLAYRGAD